METRPTLTYALFYGKVYPILEDVGAALLLGGSLNKYVPTEMCQQITITKTKSRKEIMQCLN